MVRTRQDDQGRAPRRIVGPQSALTDFLASRNISAYQIEQDFLARRTAAARQLADERQQQEDPGGFGIPTTPAAAATTTNGDSSAAVTPANGDATNGTENGTEGASGGRQLSAAQKRAVDKIKASKKFKGKKRKVFGSDEDDEEDDLALALLQSFAPLPGQMDNCAQCGKRFTVTPYSRADPTGKLLCTACSKLLDKEEDEAAKRGGAAAKKKAKPAAAAGPVGQRRKAQSRLLDGASPVGAKPLVTLCVEHLSRNIHLADDLGDLPEDVVNRIARILSKRRLLTPATVDLFIRPDAEQICVYDCAELSEGDFLRMLQAMPRLRRMTLYNAIQFKDPVMDYLLQRDGVQLEALSLYGASLLTDAKWKQFLVEKGRHLRTLQICYTDKHVTDEVVGYVKDCAPELTRLKIRGNQQVTGAGIDHVGHLRHLQHISLRLTASVHSDVYVKLLLRVGAGLQTLSLREAGGVDNAVLAAMHTHCRSLRKLRITESELCTDEGFARLFNGDVDADVDGEDDGEGGRPGSGWANPPLHVVDLQKNRFDDPDRARGSDNEDGVGFCSKGFRALMAHSGAELRHLNIFACRHISREAFEAVFDAAGKKQYPELRRIEASFCEEVTDHIVCSMFACCPNLKEVVTFGCMRVTGVQVPHGRVVVGVPNALGMQTVGQEGE